jgi:diguanylate cyclase (GGDEF)-like protein
MRRIEMLIGVQPSPEVAERQAFEDLVVQQARHDPLTGLANRAAVLDRVARDLSDADAGPVCVFFIDLDRFKLVNDSHGHAVGDQVLVALAGKLRALVPAADLVGRFGDDEFVVVTDGVATAAEAEALAARLRSTLEEPLLVGRRELFVSGSVGIAIADLGDLPETVLRNADTAMNRAKARGRNCSAFFDAPMRAEALRLLRTESDLHRAIERDQLALHFQPILSLSDDRVVGVEALVRWNHPYRGMVAPDDFIPVAEETGLVVPIGAWVLEAACEWAARAATGSSHPLRVSVNVSPLQLAQPDFVELVDAVLSKTGLDASLLCLEVTESVLVQDAHVAERTLNALRERGLRVSIDDFGTGWSSLTYLQQFPVDEIKLDRSYVSKVGDDRTSAAIVGALVGMAHTLGMTVTAEGVETEEQMRFLQAHDCDRVQGYLVARPLPGEQVLELLKGAVPVIPAQRQTCDEAVA